MKIWKGSNDKNINNEKVRNFKQFICMKLPKLQTKWQKINVSFLTKLRKKIDYDALIRLGVRDLTNFT